MGWKEFLMPKMEKNWLIAGAVILIVLIIFFVLYLARTQNEKYNSEMGKIYRFDSVKSFTYKYGMGMRGSTGFEKTNVSSENIDSTSVWLLQTQWDDWAVEKVWVDKITLKCLKRTWEDAGQEEKDIQCPYGPFYPLRDTTTSQLHYAGNESVTVPLGTFNCNKYYLGAEFRESITEKSAGDATLWVRDDIPIPVEVNVPNDLGIYYLVNYT